MALSTKTAGALFAPAEGVGEMAKIKILKNTVCSGQKVKTGQVIETTETEAILLINIGKAEPVVGEAKKPAKKTVKTSTRAKK